MGASCCDAQEKYLDAKRRHAALRARAMQLRRQHEILGLEWHEDIKSTALDLGGLRLALSVRARGKARALRIAGAFDGPRPGAPRAVVPRGARH